jgi:hypothetical protein
MSEFQTRERPAKHDGCRGFDSGDRQCSTNFQLRSIFPICQKSGMRWAPSFSDDFCLKMTYQGGLQEIF